MIIFYKFDPCAINLCLRHGEWDLYFV